jgi:FKBP-type peptidyl-prolyl cis-trans isomerase SlyD
MKIEGQVHVSIEYTLSLDSGEEIDKSEPGKPLGFISGVGQIIPGLEKQLEGKESGESMKVVVEAKDGYGEYNEEAVRDIPRQSFPEGMEIEPGMVFQANGPQGPTSIRVKELKDDAVVGDFNHPLAGENLNFDVKIGEVRDVTKEELDALEAAKAAACAPSACASCGTAGSCDDAQ